MPHFTGEIKGSGSKADGLEVIARSPRGSIRVQLGWFARDEEDEFIIWKDDWMGAKTHERMHQGVIGEWVVSMELSAKTWRLLRDLHDHFSRETPSILQTHYERRTREAIEEWETQVDRQKDTT